MDDAPTFEESEALLRIRRVAETIGKEFHMAGTVFT